MSLCLLWNQFLKLFVQKGIALLDCLFCLFKLYFFECEVVMNSCAAFGYKKGQKCVENDIV
jgi:hypothetical protein